MIKSTNTTQYYDFGVFRLDVTNRELLKDGKHISLTQKSFEILKYLILNRGRMIKKNEIINVIWTENFVEEANLAQHIYMIRKVLKDSGDDNNYIETVPKYGYRFIGDVTESGANLSALQTSVPTNGSVFNSNDQSSNYSNGYEKNGVNGNHTIVEKSLEEETSEEPINLSKTPSENTFKPFSLLIPNIIFASIFAIIIFAFVYLAYFAMPYKQASISNIESISILPFKQIGEGNDDKLGIGLADTLISRLGNQDKIAISPTATVIKYSEDDSSNSIEVGEKLNVDAILTGTIQRENDSVRVNVQLISVQEKTPLWSDKFDVKFSDVFSLQDKISEQLAKKLSIDLKDSQQTETLEAKYTPKKEALEEFEKGQMLWEDRTSSNIPKAIKHFENAIEKDDKFALAYAYLADAYSLVGLYKLEKILTSKEAFTKAKELADKALDLDSKASEAYNAYAIIALAKDDYQEAEKFYKQAINIDPENATARQRLAWLLTTHDNLDDAIKEMRVAQKTKPQSHQINLSLARLLRLNRQTDEALAFCKKAVEIDPTQTWAKMILAEIYEQKGQLDKSIKELKSVPKNTPQEKTAKLLLSRVYAKKGNKNEARKILKDATKKTKSKENASAYEVATVYAQLGEKEEAVKKLKKAKNDSLMYFLHLKYDYNIDPIRNTPEYPKILTQSKNKFTPKTTKSDDKKS